MKKIFLFIFILSLISSCIFNGQLTDCFRYYTFDFPVSIYPVNDTISIGDTLWVEINVNNLIENRETGEMIDISDFDLHFTMFNSRYDLTYHNRSIDDFDFHPTEGIHEVSSTRSFLIFDDKSNKKFKLGLIPNEPGGQVIAISVPDEILEDVDFDDECITSFKNSPKVIINNSNNQNLHLLEGRYFVNNIGDTLRWGMGDELYQITDAYAFYVQE